MLPAEIGHAYEVNDFILVRRRDIPEPDAVDVIEAMVVITPSRQNVKRKPIHRQMSVHGFQHTTNTEDVFKGAEIRYHVKLPAEMYGSI